MTEALRLMVADAIAKRKMNPWCGLCSAPDSTWIYENGATRFNSMEEAKPELKRIERENAKAREALEAIARGARN